MGKKDDPKYDVVRGHVPKQLARRFKQYCLDEEIDYSEGLERILESFFNELDTPQKNNLKKSSRTEP